MAAVLKHLVLFKFKDEAARRDIERVVDSFLELKNKIPVIQALEWGTNVSPENKHQGFTHCFCLTFPDTRSRDAYLPHPAHREFGEILKPVVEKVMVFDYFAN